MNFSFFSVIGIYEIIRVLMYVLAVIIELTFYCFPAEELTSEVRTSFKLLTNYGLDRILLG